MLYIFITQLSLHYTKGTDLIEYTDYHKKL